MKITSWILNSWWFKKVREQATCPYRFKNECDALAASCKTAIVNEAEELLIKAESLSRKLLVKGIQNTSARVCRSEYGYQQVLPNPVFSTNEAAHIKKTYWGSGIKITGLTMFETALYYSCAAILLPGSPQAIRIFIALFMTITGMLGLQLAYGQHFKFKEARVMKEAGKLSARNLSVYRDHRLWAYVTGFASLVLVIASAIGRMYFLHNIDVRGLTHERSTAVMLANSFMGIAMIAITISVSFILAREKYDCASVAEKYKVLVVWEAALQRRNTYALRMHRCAREIQFTVKKLVEKYWMLTIDLKRQFAGETEFDTKYVELDKEYVQLQTSLDLHITPAVYTKFAAIQSAHRDLFEFGILHDPVVAEILDKARELLRQSTDVLCEHAELPVEASASEINGKHNGIKHLNGTESHREHISLTN